MIELYPVVGHFVVGVLKGYLVCFGLFLLFILAQRLYESIRKKAKK